MKPYVYYQTTSVSIPKQDDYMTIYYYRKGVMVGMKVGKIEDDFQPPKNCVEEKVLDEVSYNSHMKHYQEENLRLQEEFRKDLIAEYKMSHHSKADKLFNKAWDMGCAGGLEEVEYYFRDLVELFQDNETNIDATIFDIMTT
jgi:transcription termination factor NusB